MSGGKKFDSGKTRYDLLPPELLEAVATVLTDGAEKYGDRNWEAGLSYGRVFAAMMRHLWAWWRCDDLDADSGRSHLWHAATELAFLIAFEARRMPGLDDRSEASRFASMPMKTSRSA